MNIADGAAAAAPPPLPSQDPNAVRLGASTVVLEAPASQTTCWDLGLAVAKNRQRAYAAALGCCSRQVATWVGRNSWDVLEYGGWVQDHLLSIGVSRAQIQAAGLKAWNLATTGLITSEEVEERAKNS